MPISDRNIVIIPNRGGATEPVIRFTGADATSSATITLRVLNTGTVGTLSFEGSSGQLFSLSDTLSGTIFSVNDISGIPSIEVLDTGEIRLAQYGGFVNIPNTTNATTTNTGALRVTGGVGIGGDLRVGGTIFGTVSGSITSAATVAVTNDNASTAPQYITFVNTSTGNVAIKVDAPEGLTFIPSSNFLGLGQPNPVSPFNIRMAGTNIASTFFESMRVVNAAGTKGLALGYDNASQAGIIAAVSSGVESSIEFWTYETSIGLGWSERIKIDPQGRLLAGTSTAPANSQVSAVFLGAPGLDGGVAVGNVNGNGGAAITSLGGAGLQLYTWTGAIGSETSTERLRVDASGNVFIGTTFTQPNSGFTNRLVVSGSMAVGTGASTNGTLLLQGIYSNGALTNIGTERSTGGPVIGYAVYPSPSTATVFVSATGINIPRSALVVADNMRYYTGPGQVAGITNTAATTEVMRVTNSGNLGIGTIDPQTKLMVTGDSPKLITAHNFSSSVTKQAGFNYRIDTTDLWQTFVDNAASNSWKLNYNDSTNIITIDVAGNTLLNGTLDVRLPAAGNYASIRGFTNSAANLVLQSNITSGTAYWITAKHNGALHIGGNGGTEPATGVIVVTSGGLVAIGHGTPQAKVDIFQSGAINITTPGINRYGLHFTPESATADHATGITFGAGMSSSGATAQAGIYVQASGSYGTKMYLATTDSFAAAAKTRVTIDHVGRVGIGVVPNFALDVSGDIEYTGYTYHNGYKTAHVYIKGTGANNSAAPIVAINGTNQLASYGRGLMLVIINKTTLVKVSDTTYDTYGDAAASNNLAIALNQMTNNHIGILVSFDAIEANITANLRTAARLKGLFKLAASSTGGNIRRPYAAIFTAGGDGTTGVVSRNVLEIYEYSSGQQPMAVITTHISTDGTQAAGFTGNNITNALISGEPNTTDPVVFVDSSDRVGINTVNPQSLLDVITPSNGYVSFGRTMGVGAWTGIHFGYREDNTNYRKSAIVFERTDNSGGGGNAAGKIHILNGPETGAGSATLADAKVTIGETGNVGIGSTAPGSKLVVVGGATGNAVPVLRLTSTQSDTFNWASSAMNASLTAGENFIHLIGQAESGKNSGYIGYKWNGAGSNSNILTFGHYGSDNLMNLTADGKLGIGIQGPSYMLDITAGSVGTTAGNQNLVQRLYATTANNDYLEITNNRGTTGSDWQTAGFRIQQKVDSTWMGYIQFNGTANGTNNGGITFGAGTTTTSANSVSERLRIDGSGNVIVQSGFLRLPTGGIGSDSGTFNGLRILSPGGATTATSASTLTGSIRIRLPQGYTDTMLRMRIKVYTYDGLSFDITCGGYPYSGGPSWINTFAYMESQTRNTLNIRFGYDGSRVCVYIGEINTVWNYPQVFVTDFQAGYNAYGISSWANGWDVGYFNAAAFANTAAGQFITSTIPVYRAWTTGSLTNVSQLTNDAGYLTGSSMTQNYIAKWNGTTIANSRLFDDNTGYLRHEGSYFGVRTAYGNQPASHLRGSSTIVQASTQNADGSGWAYGHRFSSVDYGDGLGMSIDILYNGTWTSDALTVSGRASRIGRVGIGGVVAPDYALHVLGISYASTDIRAPIFYDSNDTNFYVDPNATSRINNLIVVGSLTLSALQSNLFINGPERRYYLGNLSANALQARRFEIARVFIDFNDWHQAGIIFVELQNNYYYGGDTQVWSISYDYNNINCDLISGNSPRGRGAQVTTSAATLISGDFYYISIYVDVRYYNQYYAYLTTSWPITTNSTGGQSGVLFVYTDPATTPGPTNIADFTAPTIVTTNNSLQSTTDVRAPIFRDSADPTNYYADLNSTTNLKYLKVNTDLSSSATRALTIKAAGQAEINFGSYPGNWNSALQIQNNSNTDFVWIGSLDDGQNARFRASGSGLDFYTDGGNDAGTRSAFIGSGAVYSPIFYDLDDTAYYANPNSTSNFVRLQTRRLAINPDGNTNDTTTGTLGLWTNPEGTTSTLMFKRTDQTWGTHGGVTDIYATYWVMDTTNRGWIFRNASTGANIFSISNNNGITTLGQSFGSTVQAQLNVSQGQGGAQTYRDIDLKGSWTGGEGHAITASYGTTAAEIVGQMVFEHNGPGSRIKWGRLYHSGNLSTYPMQFISNDASGNARLEISAGSDVRAPIYYDVNDTGYYVDPASSSFLFDLSANRYFWRGGGPHGYAYLHNTFESAAIVGSADVFGMGSTSDLLAFNLPNTAEYWNGSAWVGTTVVADMFAGRNSMRFGGNYTLTSSQTRVRFTWNSWGYKFWHAMLISGSTQGGTLQVTMETSSNGSTWVTHINSFSAGGTWPGYHYIRQQGENSTSNPWLRITIVGTLNGANNIFLNNLSLYGSYGGANSLLTWDASRNITGYGGYSTSGDIISSTAVRAPIFYDNSNSSYYLQPEVSAAWRLQTPTGYLDFGSMNSSYTHFQTDRGLFYFNTTVDVNGQVRIYADQINRFAQGYLVLRNTSPTIYFRDTDHNSAMIHVNSNIFYVLRGANDTESWGTVGSGWWPLEINLTNNDATFGGNLTTFYNFYGQIYYDRNDTAYFVDPQADRSSNINGFSARTVEGTVGTYKYNTPRYLYTTDTNYWVGTMGWSTTDINSVFDWGSGFWESWGGPANQPSGTTHWNGIQSLHYTNGSTRYGWQMTMGAGSPSLTYIRGVWGGGFTPWYKIQLLGINQGSFASYASIYYDADDTSYFLDPNGGGSLLRGRVNVTGGHGSSSIRNYLAASENGASTGIVTLQMWCSEPGNTWDGAGFGYNVDNNLNESGNVPAYYFGRPNTSFGQAYMRMTTDGNWYFYNTPNASNTRYTTMRLDRTGYVEAYQSSRAPIFYDSDNTAYYLDPASSSVLNADLTTNDFYARNWFRNNQSGYGLYNQATGNHWYSDGAYWNIGYGGTQGIRLRNGYGGGVLGYYYGETNGNTGLLHASGGWAVRVNTSEVELYNAVYWINAYGSIVYDRNDTNYYVDPASTTRFNRLYINARNDNYNVGSLGPTNSVSNWQSLTDTSGQWTVTQFNGIGSFTNSPPSVYTFGAVMSWRTDNHSFQLYAAHTGDLAYKTQWNNDNYSGWLYPMVYGRSTGAGAVYGTIYYDANDTNYYADPNSTSRMNYLVPNRIKCVNNVNNEPRWDFSAYVVEAQHWYGNNASMTMYLGEGNPVQIPGTPRAPIYYDYNDTAYYIDPNANTSIRTVGSWRADSASWDGEFSGKIQYHASNWYFQYASQFIFRNSGGSNVFYGDTSGNSWSIASSRAPIFYDSDNTGYYTDPNNISRMNQIQANTYYSPYSGGDSGLTRASYPYGWGFQEGGAWGFPYPDLVLQYHTGITMAANASYQGIRFKADYNDDTLIFQVNGDSNYLYKYRWMKTDTSGFYSDTNGWHIEPNALSSYGSMAIRGSRGGWYGIHFYLGGSTPHIMWDGSGNGGFYHEGTGRWVQYYSNGNNCTGFGTSTTNSAYGIYVVKGIYSEGNVVAYSDRRAKDNIITIDNALDKIEKLRGVYFNYKSTPDKTDVGVIAQEVLDVVPEVVDYDKENDKYSVAYGNLTAVLIEAVKELSEEVKRLKKKLGED